MAELFLDHSLKAGARSRRGETQGATAGSGLWSVSSAGLSAADEQPIHRLAGRVLGEHGISAEQFRSRRLSADLVAASDLILTAERSHRREVTAIDPRAAGRTFTIKQFARLVDTEPQATDGATLLERARQRQGIVVGDDDDIADPVGRSVRRVRRCAGELLAAMSAFAAVVDLPEAGRRRRGRSRR